MLKPILSTNGKNRQDQLGGMIIDPKCREMYKWEVQVKPLKEGRQVSCQGMSGR